MQRIRLKNIYDCINRIAQKHEANGTDRSAWFYSENEINHLKKDKQNTFL